jgi:fido (protein-threonine AMPylation protein)
VSEGFLQRHALESRIVLRSIGDAADILRHLLEGGHPYVAGRLAGAFRSCGRAEIADEILATMTGAGYNVRETNPFTDTPALVTESKVMSPIESRIRNLWASMRQDVLNRFPAPPGLPQDPHQYLQLVEENYASDAYHSLSLEGYSVSPELVERVRAGNWNPDTHQADRQSRDALAARGYWQAFQVVKANVGEVIGGANAGALARRTHREWYRELFNPCVAAGLIPATALAGYRNDAVYLRTSRYVPPRWEAAREAVPILFDLLENETEPGVKAVLGHWLFGYIHPYPDGNGRMARFLMNAMLASGGYPWTIIRVEDRADYLRALDEASIESNIGPFADFLASRVVRSSLTSI